MLTHGPGCVPRVADGSELLCTVSGMDRSECTVISVLKPSLIRLFYRNLQDVEQLRRKVGIAVMKPELWTLNETADYNTHSRGTNSQVNSLSYRLLSPIRFLRTLSNPSSNL